jgi:hypothetical protein
VVDRFTIGRPRKVHFGARVRFKSYSKAVANHLLCAVSPKFLGCARTTFLVVRFTNTTIAAITIPVATTAATLLLRNSASVARVAPLWSATCAADVCEVEVTFALAEYLWSKKFPVGDE